MLEGPQICMLKGNVGRMKLEKQRQNENKYNKKTFLAFVKKNISRESAL